MEKNERYVKTTIQIPRATCVTISRLQQSRHIQTIQHAVELGLQWVVAIAMELQKAEINCKDDYCNKIYGILKSKYEYVENKDVDKSVLHILRNCYHNDRQSLNRIQKHIEV
jgi:hypothetical protein